VSEAAAWFSALGEPLDEAERAEIDAYLAGLGLRCPVHSVSSWQEAFDVSNRPAPAWWAAEEAERARLEKSVQLNAAEPEWLALNEALHGAAAVAAARAGCSSAALIRAAAGAASYAAYQARLLPMRRAPARSTRSCASTPYTAAGAGRSASMRADLRSSNERR
jgi:hypothetical protein